VFQGCQDFLIEVHPSLISHEFRLWLSESDPQHKNAAAQLLILWHLFLASGPPRKFGQPLKDPGPKITWPDFDVQLVIQHVDFDVLRCNHGLSMYLSFSGPFQ
jgi:hypothetical protein